MITRNQYEESFLLYLDNELSPADRQDVETFVKENPDLKEELETLRQCRLIPEDEITFGSLEPLLRYAAAGRFIIPARRYPMIRIAAAALLLLSAGLGLYMTLKKNTGAPLAVSAGPNAAKKKDRPAVTQATPRALYLSTTDRQHDRTDHQPEQPEAGLSNHQPAPIGAGQSGQQPIPHLESASAVHHLRPANRLRPGNRLRPVNDRSLVNDRQNTDRPQPRSPGKEATDPAPDQALASSQLKVPQRMAHIDPVNTRLPEKIVVEDNNSGSSDRFGQSSTTGSGGSLVTQAAQRDVAASAEEDFSTDQDPAGKNKLRGVFRKISRVFEKTANRGEDDKQGILIGNLQIALK